MNPQKDEFNSKESEEDNLETAPRYEDILSECKQAYFVVNSLFFEMRGLFNVNNGEKGKKRAEELVKSIETVDLTQKQLVEALLHFLYNYSSGVVALNQYAVNQKANRVVKVEKAKQICEAFKKKIKIKEFLQHLEQFNFTAADAKLLESGNNVETFAAERSRITKIPAKVLQCLVSPPFDLDISTVIDEQGNNILHKLAEKNTPEALRALVHLLPGLPLYLNPTSEKQKHHTIRNIEKEEKSKELISDAKEDTVIDADYEPESPLEISFHESEDIKTAVEAPFAANENYHKDCLDLNKVTPGRAYAALTAKNDNNESPLNILLRNRVAKTEFVEADDAFLNTIILFELYDNKQLKQDNNFERFAIKVITHIENKETLNDDASKNYFKFINEYCAKNISIKEKQEFKKLLNKVILFALQQDKICDHLDEAYFKFISSYSKRNAEIKEEKEFQEILNKIVNEVNVNKEFFDSESTVVQNTLTFLTDNGYKQKEEKQAKLYLLIHNKYTQTLENIMYYLAIAMLGFAIGALVIGFDFASLASVGNNLWLVAAATIVPTVIIMISHVALWRFKSFNNDEKNEDDESFSNFIFLAERKLNWYFRQLSPKNMDRQRWVSFAIWFTAVLIASAIIMAALGVPGIETAFNVVGHNLGNAFLALKGAFTITIAVVAATAALLGTTLLINIKSLWQNLGFFQPGKIEISSADKTIKVDLTVGKDRPGVDKMKSSLSYNTLFKYEQNLVGEIAYTSKSKLKSSKP